MMPVMPMDPVSRAAAVAQAMVETAASQSMEPGPAGDAVALAGGGAQGAAEVMPVPPSTSMAAGTSVSLAPSEVRADAKGGPGGGEAKSQAGGEAVAGTAAGGRERVTEKGAELSVPVLQGDLHATTMMGPQRRRVEREGGQGRRRQRRRPVPFHHDGDEPESDPQAAWLAFNATTTRRPLTMASLCALAARHAGGLAWTEWHEGRCVIVVDTARADEGQLRGALLLQDPQGNKAFLGWRAATTPGWGWAWRQLSGRHWRLRRDLDASGRPVLISPDQAGHRSFCICLHHAEAPRPEDEGADLVLRITLADPLRFHKRLGRQWTYLALLQSLDDEFNEPSPLEPVSPLVP